MIEFVLKALEFGVLGLCAITLILVWRILLAEQKREGYPRKGILQASYVFMGFSIVLALLNTFVQLKEAAPSEEFVQQISSLEEELRLKEDKLLQIKSAATPIIGARSTIIRRLPDGPEKDTLKILVDSLKNNLE